VSAVLTVHDYGDAALLVDVTGNDAEQNWSRARSLGAALRDHPSVTDVVATYHHVFVAFDPLTADGIEIRMAITELAKLAVAEHSPRRLIVPVVYGGAFGPDLDDVAVFLGVDVQDVVDLHSGTDWVIRFVGSPVGAPFLDGPRMPASVPRLADPRTRVETGSVALSGFQSMIYNAPSPGGWQVIGRTSLRPFVIDRNPHLPYRPGDVIRFRPIEALDCEGIS
jgi:KipI family sensor histidine kinase inhibitor